MHAEPPADPQTPPQAAAGRFERRLVAANGGLLIALMAAMALLVIANVIGRYVFTAGIFEALMETKPGVGGEIQLTDAIGLLLDREPVHGVVFSEGRYDIGRKFDFLRANIELGLERDDLREPLEQLMVDLVHKRGLA